MRLSSVFNQAIHGLMVRYVQHIYRKGIKERKNEIPEIFPKVSDQIRREHVRLWGKLGYKVNDGWLRQQIGLSGILDPRFCPEDLFYTVIERCLNHCDASGSGIENKIDSLFFIPKKYQPKIILSYMRGVFFDGDMNPITYKQAEDLLKAYKGEVIGKPALFSSGGKGVQLFFSDGASIKKTSSGHTLSADWIQKNQTAYVVQERIIQEERISALNPNSLNTCRMMTFRRPWSGEVSVIGAMLRIGGGDFLCG